MTSERRPTPGEWPCTSVDPVAASSLMGVSRKRKGDVTPGPCGATWDPGTSHPVTRQGRGSLHMIVVGVLADVADIEDDGFLAEVLPPVRGTEHFGAYVAGLVHDRRGAVRGIFDDLALLHEDQRGTVVVAVPGHDAAGLDGQFPEAQFAILDVGRLLFQVDRAERDVGDADRLVVDLLAHVGLHLAGGT